jgi:uncharacterized protein YlxP (DUF503 family)
MMSYIAEQQELRKARVFADKQFKNIQKELIERGAARLLVTTAEVDSEEFFDRETISSYTEVPKDYPTILHELGYSVKLIATEEEEIGDYNTPRMRIKTYYEVTIPRENKTD